MTIKKNPRGPRNKPILQTTPQKQNSKNGFVQQDPIENIFFIYRMFYSGKNHRRILKIVPAKTRPFLQFNPFLPSETCRSIFATLVPVGHKKHHLRYQLGKQLLTFSFNKPTNVIIAFAQLQMDAICILSKKIL